MCFYKLWTKMSYKHTNLKRQGSKFNSKWLFSTLLAGSTMYKLKLGNFDSGNLVIILTQTVVKNYYIWGQKLVIALGFQWIAHSGKWLLLLISKTVTNCWSRKCTDRVIRNDHFQGYSKVQKWLKSWLIWSLIGSNRVNSMKWYILTL